MNNDMNDMLGRVLNDPQAMSGLMKIAQGLMNNPPPPSSPPSPPEEAPEPTSPPDAQPEGMLPPGLLSGLPKILAYDENRTNLLCALKPYLSDSRREMVEQMVNLMKILQFAGNMQQGGV